MKYFTIRLTIALATFLIGVSIVAFWFLNRPLPTVSLPQNAPECISESSEEIFLSRSENAERTKILTLFREVPLDKQMADVDESYRLIWFPTFDAPTVIRIWRSGENFFIVTKRLSGKDGYELGKLKTEQTRSVTAEEWNNFLNLLNNRCFWNAPSIVKEVPVVDGASWRFEGSRNKHHHFVDRISPSDQMKEIFRALFELTGVKTEYNDYL